MEFNLGDKVRYKRTRETGIITKIDRNFKIYGTIYTLEITMGKKILHLLPIIEERIGDYIEKVNEPTPYEPYTHQEMSFVKETTFDELKKYMSNADARFDPYGNYVANSGFANQPSTWSETEYCLPYLKGCEQPKLKPLGEAPKIRSVKFWNETKTIGKNMYDIPFTEKLKSVSMKDFRLFEGGFRRGKDRAYIENMFSTEPLEKLDFKLSIPIREHLEKITAPNLDYNRFILGIRENKGEEKMRTGLPYSVNFVEKHKRTTLVWHTVDNYYNYGISGEYYKIEEKYETTKSEAHNEKFNHLYGFLMAYFKRVHKNKSKTQLKKYLNTVVYPMSKMSQLAFLQGVFYENCGLGFKEAKDYLDKVEKGIEIKND